MAKDNWKLKVGFPINYDSSEEDPDNKDVVMRYRQSEYLLEDGGDGAEADLLGSTPPRQRQRENLKKIRNKPEMSRLTQGNSVSRVDSFSGKNKKYLSRTKSRNSRDDLITDDRSESLPYGADAARAVPTLVESCSRFMSLSSRLKCREATPLERSPSPPSPVQRRVPSRAPRDPRSDPDNTQDEAPASRVNFHKIFSTLINMGNIDKGCRRTISREEQVWQNELKDLIWLELQARLAGRTLAQQDAFLCAQRKILPTILQNIRDYRFVNTNPCRYQRTRTSGSRENLAADNDAGEKQETDDIDGSISGCLSLSCEDCSAATGKAMREVATLLDSFYNAHALYPSSKALTNDHPLVATQLFQNRIKAMCLWYNTALHIRLKVLAVRRLLRTVKSKNHRRGFNHLASTDSDISRQSSEVRRSTVRFNVSSTPTDSNNSDSSHEEHKESSDDAEGGAEKRDADEGGGGEGKEGKVDEVDCAAGVEGGDRTPEIVISESKYSTTDTVASSESGYSTSAEAEASRHHDSVFELGGLEDLTQLRLLGKCDVSPYRIYHQEMLKTQGIRRCMQFMNKMRMNVLHKVHLTLEKPQSVNETKTDLTEEDPTEVFDDTKDDEEAKDSEQDEEAKRTYEMRRYGCWSEESLAMRLPSYRSHLLLLSSICMEAVHDYLMMRLEDRPANPSCLTVKQLIHDLKEGLDIATEMRTAYSRNIEVVLAGQTGGRGDAQVRNDLLLLIRTYDATVHTVLKEYLSYLRTMSVVEPMPRNVLQQEWAFTARLARRHRPAAEEAPIAFSEIACNQLERIKNQFEWKFKELDKEEEGVGVGETGRHMVYALCREAQNIYASEREAAMHAATWARALAAKLARAPPPSFREQRGAIFRSLMRLRDSVVLHTREIVSRSRAATGVTSSTQRDPSASTQALSDDARDDAVAARLRELLLQAHKLGFDLHKELYRFAQAPFQALENRLSKRRPISLQPIRPQAVQLRRRRPETMIVHESFNPMIHKELHRLVNEPSVRACPSVGPRRAGAAGSPPRAQRVKLFRSESINEDSELACSVLDDRLFDTINAYGEKQTQTSIELLLSGEQPPDEVEYRPSALAMAEAKVSEEERGWAIEVARAVVEFARCWMQFVVERCDKGRGLRPRWASQGLEFLMLACDPCNTKHLTDAEFEELKKEMDSCISHVIGSRPASARAQDAAPHSPVPALRQRQRPTAQHGQLSVQSDRLWNKDVPSPPTPPCEPDPLLSFEGLEPTPHNARVLEAIKCLDASRDAKLRERMSVGRVLDAVVASYEPKLRQLKFKWQRGLKIGAGTFGKVYTVVNTESGQLLAMKEISIAAGDRRALQKAANELRVLEGVIHPHLVRYYGCELHREEMLLFMELCVEGSLEALIVNSGALAEPTVRRYCKQLISAVAELHARGIAHRDIKSGNIFLTNEGHCLKLGDFGCAVKIRANTTAAGELQGCVGTQAYMAPEVFMKSGHGRAADIWSLGCVVTEMASGKRPFSEYDSNYQIMFVVGMGGRPQIPSSLSLEGQQFCLACLTHEPEQRPKAEQLSLHHFLMVKSDEDCECKPSFLI